MPETIEYVSLEPKICEDCGRSFMREIGSGERYCLPHRRPVQERIAREAISPKIADQLTAADGPVRLRYSKAYLLRELAKQIRSGSICDPRAVELAQACERVDKLLEQR
jgi:hypothetical protein